MIYKRKIDGTNDEYILDTDKLKNIEMPVYSPYVRKAFFLREYKQANIFTDFQLKYDTKTFAEISGELLLPKGYKSPKVKARITYDNLIDILEWSISEDKNVMYNPLMEKYLTAIYKALLCGISDDIIDMNKIYPMTGFLIKGDDIIAISNTVSFIKMNDDGSLYVQLDKFKGTPMSVLKDDAYFVLILMNDEGEYVIKHIAKAVRASNTSIYANVSVNEKRVAKEVIDMCDDVIDKYGKDHLNAYFIDKMEKKEGCDIFGAF